MDARWLGIPLPSIGGGLIVLFCLVIALSATSVRGHQGGRLIGETVMWTIALIIFTFIVVNITYYFHIRE
jgi:hypothetical protein